MAAKSIDQRIKELQTKKERADKIRLHKAEIDKNRKALIALRGK